MRTTVRLDDDLLEDLKARARREDVSLTKLVNRVLRAGLKASRHPPRLRPFRERPKAMGAPRMALDRALALAATLEDAEIAREMALRK